MILGECQNVYLSFPNHRSGNRDHGNLLAGWGVFSPQKLMAIVTSAMDKPWGIHIAVIVRLVLGLALIVVAPTSQFPIVFQALGVIAILAAITLDEAVDITVVSGMLDRFEAIVSVKPTAI